MIHRDMLRKLMQNGSIRTWILPTNSEGLSECIVQIASNIAIFLISMHFLSLIIKDTAPYSNISPKNYQLWYHRRALLEIRFGGEAGDALLEVARKELDYVDRILDDDSKNYHVSTL